jgi:cholesterol 25-hydroxylase
MNEKGNYKSSRVSTKERTVLIPRIVLCLILFTTLALPSLYSSIITSIYSFLRSTAIYNLSAFETIEIFSWGLILLPLYAARFAKASAVCTFTPEGIPMASPTSVLPAFVPQGPPLHFSQPFYRRAIAYSSESSGYMAAFMLLNSILLMLDFTFVKKYAGVSIGDIRESGGYSRIPEAGQKNISGSFLSLTFHNFTMSSPLQISRALPLEAPSSQRLMLELLGALLVYDMLYFFCHLAVHDSNILGSIHSWCHNYSTKLCFTKSLCLLIERLFVMLLASFSLNIIGSHVLTRSVFIPIFMALLIETNARHDLAWGYDKILPKGFASKAREHNLGKGGGGHKNAIDLAAFFSFWDMVIVCVIVALCFFGF